SAPTAPSARTSRQPSSTPAAVPARTRAAAARIARAAVAGSVVGSCTASAQRAWTTWSTGIRSTRGTSTQAATAACSSGSVRGVDRGRRRGRAEGAGGGGEDRRAAVGPDQPGQGLVVEQHQRSPWRAGRITGARRDPEWGDPERADRAGLQTGGDRQLRPGQV